MECGDDDAVRYEQDAGESYFEKEGLRCRRWIAHLLVRA